MARTATTGAGVTIAKAQDPCGCCSRVAQRRPPPQIVVIRRRCTVAQGATPSWLW
jgi:hypothetical protein